jgi:hypothetical protein
LCQHFDIRERTILSKTDNLAALFWQRKGSTTSDKVPPYLLRLFGIHQRLHHYVPRHDYIPGGSNALADDASGLFHLPDEAFTPFTLPFIIWQFRRNSKEKHTFSLNSIVLPLSTHSNQIMPRFCKICQEEFPSASKLSEHLKNTAAVVTTGRLSNVLTATETTLWMETA